MPWFWLKVFQIFRALLTKTGSWCLWCNLSLFNIYLFSALVDGFAAAVFRPSILIHARCERVSRGNPPKMSWKEAEREKNVFRIGIILWLRFPPASLLDLPWARRESENPSYDECSVGQCAYCLFCVHADCGREFNLRAVTNRRQTHDSPKRARLGLNFNEERFLIK